MESDVLGLGEPKDESKTLTSFVEEKVILMINSVVMMETVGKTVSETKTDRLGPTETNVGRGMAIVVGVMVVPVVMVAEEDGLLMAGVAIVEVKVILSVTVGILK